MTNSLTNDGSRRNVLDEPVRDDLISELCNARLISAQARDAVLGVDQHPRHWWRWADRMLLFLGSALVLAGVIFFFAYNWSRMHAVAKFSCIEVGLWLCAIGALQRGLDKLTGKVLLLSASVLVGTLLAVYGQVYQTGADAWPIYAIWAILILPWVLIARFNALWIVWLVVSNVAVLLFWFQSRVPRNFDFVFGVFLLLAIGNSIALASREIGLQRGLDWLGGRWARQLIWLAVLVYLTIPTLALIVEPESGFGNGSVFGPFGLVIALFVGHQYFQTRQPDLLCLGFGLMSLCIVLLTLVGRVIFEGSSDAGAFFIFGLFVLGSFSAAAFYLRSLARNIGDAGS